MDGPPEASPPMSAPLLLWVILLRWATSGGFVRGGRTWQHCTGRSEGQRVGCARREASRRVLAMPTVGVPGCQRAESRGDSTARCQLPAPRLHPRAVGGGVFPMPAARRHATGPGSNQPFSVPWGELWLFIHCDRFPCGMSFVPRSGGSGDQLEEGKGWKEE